MVRAILDCRKTQTRRVIKPDWSRCLDLDDPADRSQAVAGCPQGKRGDRLWVRETWGCKEADHPLVPDGRKPRPGDSIVYRANPGDAWQWRGRPGDPGMGDFVWRPSIYMPRWASRIDLEVTAVRVERLQAITEDDARWEGVGHALGDDHPEVSRLLTAADLVQTDRRVAAFAWLWDNLNAKRRYPWASNPWVWVVEFRRVR